MSLPRAVLQAASAHPRRPLGRRSRATPNYINRQGIEDCLKRALDLHLPQGTPRSVLDLGCGERIYEAYFQDPLTRYFASDIVSNPRADVLTSGEQLAFRETSFDAVVSIQVLEHVADPGRVIEEIARVLKPGGVLFLSTHGSFVFHPTPEDHWRWTQTGLSRLLGRDGRLNVVSIEPVAGTFGSLAFLNAWYADVLLRAVERRAGWVAFPIRLLRRLVLAALNTSGLLLDRLLPDYRRLDRPNTFFASFLAVCRRPVGSGTGPGAGEGRPARP